MSLKPFEINIPDKAQTFPPSGEVLKKLESLTTELLRHIENQNRLIERLHSELTRARRRMRELEESNHFLEERLKEIVERMEAGLEDWARRESARRRMSLLGVFGESPTR